MIEIDGSLGEGGGQILRYASALATLSGDMVVIDKIRAKRSKPGLRPQHLAGLELLSKVSGSTIEGLKVGSSRVKLIPGELEGGSYEHDIGTAGSITLMVQSILPTLVLANKRSTITITGGTDVKWSPTADYTRFVFLTTLREFGVDANLELLKRGYYPRGGGRMVLRVNPVDTLRSASITREEITSTRIRSVCSNLPSHVAERQRSSAERILRGNGVENIEADVETLSSPKAVAKGTSIVVYSKQTSGVACGGDSVGERGKPAEDVGREAAERHLNWFRSQASVDINLGDMLIPYCCLADGTCSFSVPEMTGHMRTALSVQERIVGASYDVQKEEDIVRLSIEGKGWARSQRV